MARKRKDQTEQPVNQETPKVGGNVSQATLREFERNYVAAKLKVDEARGALGSLCKQAKENGIDVKTVKDLLKLKQLLPPDMDARLTTFTNYSKQLGLFDIIQEYRQQQAAEDNQASVDAAERANAKAKKSNGHADPKSGGASQAAYAQGFEAAKSDTNMDANPYTLGTDNYAQWANGWEAGSVPDAA